VKRIGRRSQAVTALVGAEEAIIGVMKVVVNLTAPIVPVAGAAAER
jgi:hypothetical protein